MSALVKSETQELIRPQSAAADAFDLLQRQAKMLASSSLIPETYRGKVADCAIVIEMAQRIGASPLLIANNLDVIYGRPAWRSQFLIACANQCGRFSVLRYEFTGTPGKPDRGCRAWAIERETGQRLDGIWITWDMASKEGWTSKKGSKWLTMPDQMFTYRAAAFWTRVYAPDLTMGLPTGDEVRDMVDVTPKGVQGGAIAAINAALTHSATPEAEKPAGDVTALPTPAQWFDRISAAVTHDEINDLASIIGEYDERTAAEMVTAADEQRTKIDL